MRSIKDRWGIIVTGTKTRRSITVTIKEYSRRVADVWIDALRSLTTDSSSLMESFKNLSSNCGSISALQTCVTSSTRDVGAAVSDPKAILRFYEH